MPWLYALVSLVIGFAILLMGGEFLVRSAVSLAARLRISPAIIGLTIIAAGTSAPELVTSLTASLKGAQDIALGNIVGSNLFNILVIIGFSALIRANIVDRGLAKVEVPILVACTLVLILFEWDLRIERYEGLMATLGLVGLLTFSVMRSRKEGYSPEEDGAIEVLKSPTRDVVYLVVGVLFLLGGSQLALDGGVKLGELFGLTERVIGLTIISMGTGLPELATSVVAAYRGRDDIAISNVVGSNLFNTLGIVGVAGLVQPLDVELEILQVDSMILLIITTLLLAVIWLGKLVIHRTTGAFMLAGYFAYLAFLIQR